MNTTLRVILLALVISTALTTRAVAGELASSSPGQKALRGASNLFLGLVIEWPKTICYEAREQGPLLGIPAGFLAGFGLGAEQLITAADALIDPILCAVVVFTRKWSFSPLLPTDIKLLRRQLRLPFLIGLSWLVLHS